MRNNIAIPIILAILFCASFLLESQKTYSTQYLSNTIKDVDKEQYYNLLESLQGKNYYDDAVVNTKVSYPLFLNNTLIVLLKFISSAGILDWILLLFQKKQNKEV